MESTERARPTAGHRHTSVVCDDTQSLGRARSGVRGADARALRVAWRPDRAHPVAVMAAPRQRDDAHLSSRTQDIAVDDGNHEAPATPHGCVSARVGSPTPKDARPHLDGLCGHPERVHRFALRQPAARACASLQNQRSPFAGLIRVRS